MTNDEFLALFQRNLGAIGTMIRHLPIVFGPADRLIDRSGCRHWGLLVNTVSGRVEIGVAAFFGHGVMLLTGTHDFAKTGYDRVNTFPKEGRDIIVEDGAYVGSGCIVLGPCRIGKDAVVYAGSVVTHDVPASEIHAGVPAVKIGEISSKLQ